MRQRGAFPCIGEPTETVETQSVSGQLGSPCETIILADESVIPPSTRIHRSQRESNILELVRWCGTLHAKRTQAAQPANYSFVDNVFHLWNSDICMSTNVDGVLRQRCDIRSYSWIFLFQSTVDQAVGSMCISTWGLSCQYALRLQDNRRVPSTHRLHRTRIRSERRLKCLPTFRLGALPQFPSITTWIPLCFPMFPMPAERFWDYLTVLSNETPFNILSATPSKPPHGWWFFC